MAVSKPALHDCPRCHHRRTRKPFCKFCTAWTDKEAKARAQLRRHQGTVANLGAEAYLAAIKTPDGFTRETIVDTGHGYNGDRSVPGLRLTGHDGTTTLTIVMTDADDTWAPGTGHTEFTTSAGQFSFDRTGVEDSFYIRSDDTVPVTDTTIAAQIAKVISARARHLISEKVPFVGHVITPERKTEITAKFKAGQSHQFLPSGFGTGYDCSVKPRSRWATRAPQAMADFFGVATLFYETMDCD